MSIFALICPNGLGHFRRVVGILHELSALRPGLEISLLAPRAAGERLADWEKLRHDSWQWHYFPEGEPAVRWELEAAAYRDDSLLKWEKVLENIEAFHTAELVLSDNLSGVLARRPDAILSGNFLWSEVLENAYPEEPAVQRFVQRERSLLKAHRPYMLCVEKLAMPAVKTLTRPVGLGFFAQGQRMDAQRQKAGRPRIALLGGGTGKARKILLQAVRDLAKADAYQLALPEDLLEQARKEGLPGIEPFGFRPADFYACELVICRPGVGTITDCVQATTPLIALYEEGNVEMQYLARFLSKSGLGADPGHTDLLPVVEKMLQPAVLGKYRRNLRQQPIDGIREAARFLLSALLSRTSQK